WGWGVGGGAGLRAACPELADAIPAAPAAPEVAAAPGNKPRSFGVQSFADRVADLAGVERLEGFNLRELLSASFRRYKLEEIEAHFAVGNAKDTPALSEIEPGWPKPWMFVRLLAGTAGVFAGFFLMLMFFPNGKLLPALIVVGSFAVPMATLIFFFELNSPRNVSLYLVLRSVLLGGLVSIACALFLFSATRIFSWVG